MMVSNRPVIEGYNLEHLSRLSLLGIVHGLSGKLKMTHFYVCMSEPSFATTASKHACLSPTWQEIASPKTGLAGEPTSRKVKAVIYMC